MTTLTPLPATRASKRGKCEGRKAHVELNPQAVALAKRLHRASPRRATIGLPAPCSTSFLISQGIVCVSNCVEGTVRTSSGAGGPGDLNAEVHLRTWLGRLEQVLALLTPPARCALWSAA